MRHQRHADKHNLVQTRCVVPTVSADGIALPMVFNRATQKELNTFDPDLK
jgi:hypothetical protein